jgi:DnaJ-class molecular chaperone
MIKHSPYQIIGVGEQASGAEIRQAYLTLVKAYPPERDQQKFREINQAYEAIKDEDSRLQYALFCLPELEFEQLLDDAFSRKPTLSPMAPDDFLKLFNRETIDRALARACKESS